MEGNAPRGPLDANGPTATLVWQREKTPAKLHTLLKTIGTEYPIFEGTDRGIALRFTRTKGTSCTLTVNGNTATISYGDVTHAARGVGALLAGLVKDGQTWTEQCPFATFGIMLDCSRNAVMTVDHFKAWLRRLALLGYNMAMLYTEDTYQLPDEPFFGRLRGAYSFRELRDIDEYAAGLGIEMIPCIQTLGHLSQVLKWPAYREVADTDSVLLVDDPKTYALIEKMIAHWSGVFRTRRIHVGMDETHTLGRGKFMDRFGYENVFDIFNRHLVRVLEICNKHAMKPMIWSDMYFRFASRTNEYYDKATVIPREMTVKIPKDVELVYWDYYHKDKEFYLDWIARHREMGYEPLMGSGVWTWSKIWYDRQLTEAGAGACIEACRETGLGEIFFTLWGDDGGYCDFDSAFAGLAYAAEKAFTNHIDEQVLSARFKALCKGDYSAVCLASELNRILDPSQVLWDDPLLGMYLIMERSHGSEALRDAERRYRALAGDLTAYLAACEAGDLNHIRTTALFLADKVALAEKLYNAFAAKDTVQLQAVCKKLPVVQDGLHKLSRSFRDIWLAHNKPFGMEVLQIRLAGQIARYSELANRLDEYLTGKIGSIPELEAQLTQMPSTIIGSKYRNLASSSTIL